MSSRQTSLDSCSHGWLMKLFGAFTSVVVPKEKFTICSEMFLVHIWQWWLCTLQYSITLFHQLAVDGRELWVTGNVVSNTAAYITIEYSLLEIFIKFGQKYRVKIDNNNLTTMIRPVKAIHKKPCPHEESWFSIEWVIVQVTAIVINDNSWRYRIEHFSLK